MTRGKCLGVSVRGVYVLGVSIRGVSVRGGICPGGICPGGICPGGKCPGVDIRGGGGYVLKLKFATCRRRIERGRRELGPLSLDTRKEW